MKKSAVCASSKHQAPSTRETPSSKARFGIWSLVFPWCLELGVWSFSWLLSPLLALCVLTAFSAHAEGDVAGCTEGDLLDALDGGGLVAFTNDCSITLSAPIIIDLDTTIDAQGHQVTING